MQTIQWFPGHMTKALRMMEENVKLCDAVIYVLDARAPFACINKKLNALINNKPVVYLLNVDQVVKEFTSKNMRVLTTVGTTLKDGKSVYNAIIELLSEKNPSQKGKGYNQGCARYGVRYTKHRQVNGYQFLMRQKASRNGG